MAAGPETLLRYVRRLVVPSEPDEATDAALLGRFISAGDEKAFAALVDRHGPLVLHACQRVLGNVHDAEDAFQAAFLVLARKAATVRPREALPAWLHGVAHRVALKARSARARRLREAGSPLAPATDPRPDPLAEISVRELLAIIDEEVGRLPETYRLPVILCCLECRSVEEAARQLGWTRGSVKGRLERGRVRLHQRLVRRGLSLSAALAAAELSRGAASAAVLARLAAATTRGALLFAARSTAATGVSSPAAGLAGDLIKGMALGKIKTGALLVLLLGLLAVGTGLVASPFGGPEQPPKKGAVPRAAIQTVLTDLYGDPLPAGASKRIGTIRFRHGGGMINALLLAPDGKTLVTNTVYGDRNVRAWELATGKLLHQFPGHYEASGAVALTPDGTTVAIGHDSSIRFYDLQSGREVRQLQAPLGNIEGLAFSPDGNTFASGHARQTLLLWSLASGTTLAQLPAQHNRLSVLAFTADGKTLVTGDQFDPTIRLFDVATRRERHQLTRPNAPRHHARAFALSPDGSHLAVVVHQGPLSIWDVKTGRMLRELRGTRFAASAAFSPDGKTLASAESNDKADRNTLALWDVATGKKLRRLNGNAWPVSKVTFSGDGKTLIVGCEGTIRLWDVATGNECGPAAGNPASMGRAVLSADGRTLAYQADDSIRLQDLGLAREVGRLPSQHLTLAFSPDGKVLAGGTAINRVNLWDVEHGRLLRRLQSAPKSDGFAWVGYRHVVFAPDGKLLASAGPGQLQGGGIWDDAVVQLWDLATGKPGRRLTLKDAKEEFCAVEAVAFSPDGKTLAASARDGNYGSKVRVWDAATGKHLASLSAALNDADDKEPPPSAAVLFPRTPLVLPRLTFSPDGKMLTRNRLQKTIPVWETATGKVRLRLEGHQDSTVCVAFAPDGRTLASAGWDETIRLWDLVSGKELRQLTGHRGPTESLAFAPDGKTLISVGSDTTIVFWDVAALSQRPLQQSAPPAAQEWNALWAQLADADASRAYQAMQRLIAAPRLTLDSLKQRLPAAAVGEPPRLGRLLSDLDSNRFAVRDRAAREIEKLGQTVEPELRRALARAGSSLEFRRRLEQILDKIRIPSGQRLQEIRAVEVLEWIGTPEAQEALTSLAKGAPETRLTQEAKASLGRLVIRPANRP